MEFHCWGISHKSTSLEVREKFAFNKDEIDQIITKLITETPFSNGIFLSTCNRTEFYSICSRTDIKKFDLYIEKVIDKRLGVRKNDQFLFSGYEAFKHLLKVMTGIDSMIVGEPDIFGQVKKSLKNSQKHNFVNSELDDVFSKAIYLSKDIRTETNLSKNPLSIASLVESEIQKNNLKEVMIIGAGEVGKTLIKRLVKKDYKIDLFNRSSVSIEGILSKPLDQLKEYLIQNKVIVVAASGDAPFITSEDMMGMDAKLIFDLAIPRNLDEKIKELPFIELLILDEISRMVEFNLKGRKNAVTRAESIISESAETEFLRLKNKKILNREQKRVRASLSKTKHDAIDKAKLRITKGDSVEDIIDDLANEISSKNAFHVSKILDQSISKKR
jgi:glutamyl-tRNA reductase